MRQFPPRTSSESSSPGDSGNARGGNWRIDLDLFRSIKVY